MKNTMLTLLLTCCVSLSLAAQIQKGNKLLGGSFSLGGHKTETDYSVHKTFGLGATIDGGQFISNRFAVGATLGYTFSRHGESKTNHSSGLSEAWARYYAPVAADKLWLFVPVRLGYQSQSMSRPDYYDADKRFREHDSGLTYGFGAGLAYFLSPQIAVDVQAGLDGNAWRKAETSFSFTGISAGIQAYFDWRPGKSRRISSPASGQSAATVFSNGADSLPAPGTLPKIEQRGRKIYLGEQRLRSNADFARAIDAARHAEASRLNNKAKSFSNTGTGVMGVGLGMMAIGLVQSIRAARSGEPGGGSGMTLGGATVMLGGGIVVFIGGKHRKNAVRLYNKAAGY